MSTDTPNRQRESAVQQEANSVPAVEPPANNSLSENPVPNGSQENGKDEAASVAVEPAQARAGDSSVPSALAGTEGQGDGRESGATSTTVRRATGTPESTSTDAFNEWAEFSTPTQGVTIQTGPLVSAARPRGIAIPWPRIDDRISRIILSAVLAVLLWIYVVSLENPTRNTQLADLTVDIRNSGPSLKAQVTPQTVDAVVEAPQSVLASLTKSDIHPYVDLTGLGEGVHSLPVRAEVANFRASDMTVRFNPANVEVQLEVQSTHTYTVEVQTQGAPGFGYALEPPQVSPAQVSATGPREAIARIQKVVAIVDVDGKSGTQQGTKEPVALDASNQVISGITFDPPSVSVTVPLKLLLNYKIVPVHPSVIGQPAPGYLVPSITYQPTSVLICCSPTVLDAIESLSTEPVAITGTTTTVVTTTSILLPRNVDLYPGQSREMTVTVNVTVLQTTFQLSVVPTLEGLPDGWGSVVSPSKIDLTLAGPFEESQNLSPTDIRAFINVQGKGPGTYEIKPQIVVPSGIKLNLASPDTVTVTLTAPTPTPTPTTSPTPVPTATRVEVAAPATATQPVPTPTATATHTASPTATPSSGAAALETSPAPSPSRSPTPSASPTPTP